MGFDTIEINLVFLKIEITDQKLTKLMFVCLWDQVWHVTTVKLTFWELLSWFVYPK